MRMFLLLMFVALSTFVVPSMAEEFSCADCHSDILEKTLQHPALYAGCDTCHDINPKHVEDPFSNHHNGFTMPMNDLCYVCHSGMQEQPDVPGWPGSGSSAHPTSGHPVQGPSDPLYPDKPFTCASCHSPHSSVTAKLFRYDLKANPAYRGSACVVCHWDMMYPPPRPTPPWD